MLDAKNYLGKMLAERYRIVREIGHGASSVVFYAEDMMTMREDGSPMPVAVKVLDKDSGDYKLNSKSFRTEINAVVDIPTNPHTIAVKDVSFDEREHFIVMEYVSGKTLGQYLAEHGGRLSAKEIVSISLQVLQALRNAHEAGVVHRDVKPQNIMVERAAEVGRAVDIPGGRDMPFIKLADFGIALLPDEDLFAMKDKGVGTIHYISPEQASGEPVDARSDLYSLGVVMYEMATGEVPFDAQSPTGIISKHQIEMPFHVRNRNPEIPLALDHIIFTAMEKNPARRFRDAASMEKKLREVLRTLVEDRAEKAEGSATMIRPTVTVEDVGERRAPKEKRVKKQTQKRVTRMQGTGNSKKKGSLLPLAVGLVSGALVLAAAVGLILYFTVFTTKTYDVTVPKLIGSVYSESNAYADGIFVSKDAVVYRYDNEVEAGRVIEQTPSPGVFVEGTEGVEIKLVVSLGPEMTEFRLPLEYRTDYETAMKYLMFSKATEHKLLVVDGKTVAETRDPSLPSGAVVGAYRVENANPLSLDGDEVYKSKAEHIILVLNPSEWVTFSLDSIACRSATSAREAIAALYPFLTVAAEPIIGEQPDGNPLPGGTVIGIELADGSRVSTSGGAIEKTPATVRLVVTPQNVLPEQTE